MINPKVSIITVVYNAEDILKKTLESINCQTYSNIEHIIIDGNSNDNTLQILKQNLKVDTKIISEEDNGIYDAMNKGLKIANGEYIWFINAGDQIYSENIISLIFDNSLNSDAYYGDMVYINNRNEILGTRTLKKIPNSLSWYDFLYGMVVSHQSLIIKKEKVVEYDLQYKHVADLDWCIRSLQNCQSIVNSELVLSKFLIGGYSKKNIIKSNLERLKILFKHFSCLKVISSQIFLFFRFAIYFVTTKKKYY